MIQKAKFEFCGLCFLLGMSTMLGASKKSQGEAEALIKQAKTISDIESEVDMPFRLEAKFQLSRSPQASSLEGTYILVWASTGKSREEITFPGYQEIIVRNGEKTWDKRSTEFEALPAFLVKRTLNLSSHFSLRPTWKMGGVKTRKEQGVQVKCVTAGNEVDGFRELCLDPVNDYLLFEYDPTLRFLYSNYSKFGTKFFPRSLQVSAGGAMIMDVSIESLATDSAIDNASFEPPSDARETAWCEDPAPPQMMGAGLRFVSRPQTGQPALVEAWAAIGKDGNIHEAVVLRSSGGHVDTAALQKSLGGWRFRPAMCGVSPVETWTSLITNVPPSK